MARQGLDRNRVIAAARDLVNREGLDRLTMRALSQDLNVEAASLYSHVSDKNDILDGLAELIFGEIRVPPTNDPWPVRIRLYSDALREALLASPSVVPVVAVRPVISLATLQLVEDALAELTAIGLSPRQAIFTLDMLVAFAIGHVLTELSATQAISGHDPAAVAAARSALPPHLYPNLSQTLAEGAVDRTAEFDHSITIIIDGIQATLDRRKPTST